MPCSSIARVSLVSCLSLVVGGVAFAQSVDRVPGDFATIQEAVTFGSAPVISVARGDWQGATVTRRVAILGERGANIVGGPKVGNTQVGFALPKAGSNSEITGFSFRCDGPSLDMGVYASARRLGSVADAVTIDRNAFVGCVQGVTNAGNAVRGCTTTTVDGGAYWVVSDNRFTGFATRTDRGQAGGGIGVVLFNVEGADVFGNTFKGDVADRADFTTSGISLGGCQDCTIASNTFAVTGGRHFWAAVSNLGYYQRGAAPSRGVILADNDARLDSAPTEVNYRSYDSFRTELTRNSGVTLIDHTVCGDRALDLIEAD